MANPTALLLSAIMMLRHIGEFDHARFVYINLLLCLFIMMLRHIGEFDHARLDLIVNIII